MACQRVKQQADVKMQLENVAQSNYSYALFLYKVPALNPFILQLMFFIISKGQTHLQGAF